MFKINKTPVPAVLLALLAVVIAVVASYANVVVFRKTATSIIEYSLASAIENRPNVAPVVNACPMCPACTGINTEQFRLFVAAQSREVVELRQMVRELNVLVEKLQTSPTPPRKRTDLPVSTPPAKANGYRVAPSRGSGDPKGGAARVMGSPVIATPRPTEYRISPEER